MQNKIYEKITQYQTIIIHRHKRPDLDAYGSQLGLKSLIQNTFPEKKVYVVGDKSTHPFEHEMDIIDDEIYKDALVFILDTAEKLLVSDERYLLGKEVIIFDHHLNQSNIENTYFYHKPEWISCSEMVADFGINKNMIFNEYTASVIYAGIVGDSGRFQYINNQNGEHALSISSKMVSLGARIKELYDYLYVESLENRLAKAKFQNFEYTKNGIAYRFTNYQQVLDSGFDFMFVSRGTLGSMAGIKEIKIWANFTENEELKVVAELRSRDISIVDIAKKYGGGGHALACGATLQDFEEAKKMINDLIERANA